MKVIAVIVHDLRSNKAPLQVYRTPPVVATLFTYL